MHVPYTLAKKRHCAGEVTSHDKLMLRHDHLEAREQETQEGKIPDDEGDSIEDDNISHLDVAHNLPHLLVRVRSETEELVISRDWIPENAACHKGAVSADQSINPPAPRLLALHHAIGHILHLSGAGEHKDDIFRKLEDRMVQYDGSTPLAEL
ncbi:hypothetical protein ARSEF1564_007294, partial [Beauveria bassiana]